MVIGRNQNPWVECDLKKLREGFLGSDLKTDAGLERGLNIVEPLKVLFGGKDVEARPRVSHSELEELVKEGSSSSAEPASSVIAEGIVSADKKTAKEAEAKDGEVKHAESNEILLVRRRSGGGAVFHDEGNLNWTVIVPNSTQFEFKRRTHAEMVVRAIETVQQMVFDRRKDTAKARNVRVNERHDIVMDAVMERFGKRKEVTLKVSGSAFKLTRGRALHHGTLLYASPHLKSIGKLLKSQAKEYISAKGVESVRSLVGNLFYPKGFARLRRKLKRQIAEEFNRMYHDPEKDNFFALVDDADANEATEVGKEILKGMKELKSPEWTFEQTPGFSLSTKPTEGKKDLVHPTWPTDDTHIFLQVKNGIVQEAEFSAKKEGLTITPAKTRIVGELGGEWHSRSFEQIREQIRSQIEGKKLHEIEWQSLSREEGYVSLGLSKLLDWLSRVFPPLSKDPFGLSEHSPAAPNVQDESQDGDVVKREQADGVVELERKGERTVEEVGV